MSNDVKHSEEEVREIYRANFQDGLDEIFDGILLIVTGLQSYFLHLIFDLLMMPYYFVFTIVFVILIIVALPLSKRKFTFTRLGIRKLPPLPTMLKIIIFVPLILVAALIILQPIMELDFLGNGFMVPVGAYMIIMFTAYAVWLHLPRYYITGILFTVGMLFGESQIYFELNPLYGLIIPIGLGLAFLGFGIHMARQFSQKYPKKPIANM